MFKQRCLAARLALILSFSFISSTIYRADALYPYKLLHNSSHLIALKPEEWTSEYTCELDEGRNVSSKPEKAASRPNDCFREPTAWRYNYVQELSPGSFRLLIEEGSLDERMANKIYLVSGATGFYLHGNRFNSGDPEQDLRNELLVAGPQVDDAKCLKHLDEMLALLGEIQSKIVTKRNETNMRLNAKLELDLKESHFRLARALDSFGKFESGSLDGRFHAMGVYQECISTPFRLSDELISSRYCWASMSVDKHLSESLKQRRRPDSEDDSLRMLVATCLPESCHSKSFNPKHPGNEVLGKLARERLQRLVNTQYQLPETLFYEKTLELESVFCLVDESSRWAKLSLSAKMFFVATGIWLALVVIATYRRRRKHQLGNSLELAGDGASSKMKRRSLLNNLDLFESWAEFIGAREVSRQSRVELDVLNPLKFIGSATVMIVHAAIIVGPLSREAIAAVAFCESSRFEMLFMTGAVMVDTFFVISGILMTFIVLKRLNKQKQRQKAWRKQQQVQLTQVPKYPQADSNLVSASNNSARPTNKRRVALFDLEFFGTWFIISLHRYLRLVPLFFVVFWFKKAVFNHLGSGPLWDWALNVDTSIGSCRYETWLTPFSFISAYLPLARQCLPPTWSLSNNLFFSFFIPPLIILFFRRPRLAKYVSALLILAGFGLSMLAYFSIDYFYRFELERIHFHGVMILLTTASQLYTNPIYRVPAMLVGIISGHALFRYEQRSSSNRQAMSAKHEWSWSLRKVYTPVAISYILVSSLASWLLLEIREALGPERTTWLAPFTLIVYHLTWSIANGVIFLRMMTDWKESFIMQMSAGRFWRVFSKLAYALLLTHWDLLMYETSTRTSQIVFTRYSYFSSFAMAFFWSIPLSIFIHVVIENPIEKLVKTYVLRE